MRFVEGKGGIESQIAEQREWDCGLTGGERKEVFYEWNYQKGNTKSGINGGITGSG